MIDLTSASDIQPIFDYDRRIEASECVYNYIGSKVLFVAVVLHHARRLQNPVIRRESWILDCSFRRSALPTRRVIPRNVRQTLISTSKNRSDSS